MWNNHFTYIYLQFYKHIKQSTSFNKGKGTELIVQILLFKQGRENYYLQVMAVCVQRVDFCLERRDLSRSPKKITNENKADFHIYFWPQGIHYSTSHVNWEN